MTDHDPLCWAANDGRLQHACGCSMIRQARADEREKIAQAIEAKADDLPIEDYVLPDVLDVWRQAKADLHDAARIARNGGGDE